MAVTVDPQADGVHLRVSRADFVRIVRALKDSIDEGPRDAGYEYLRDDLERGALSHYSLACQGRSPEGESSPGYCGWQQPHGAHLHT